MTAGTGLTWAFCEIGEEDLAAYSRRLPLDPDANPIQALVKAIVRSPSWKDLELRSVICRPRSNPPILSFLGNFSEGSLRRLSSLSREVKSACQRLFYVSYRDAERLTHELAQMLERHLGSDRLRRARFVAIPRGGLFVLGMLSELLALRPEQLSQHETADFVVVVDDCALSGARFHGFFQDLSARSAVFCSLFSHVKLRQAIQEREERLEACLSARDLALVGEERPELPAEHLAESQYWVGSLEHCSFPWTEPDRVVIDGETGRPWPAWKLVPPSLCLKNRAETAAPLQWNEDLGGELQPSEGTVYAHVPEGVALANRRTGQSSLLRGASLDWWQRLLSRKAGAPPFEGGEEDLVDSLLAQGFLERASERP